MAFVYNLILLWSVGVLLSIGVYLFWSSTGKFMLAMGAIASVSAYITLITLNSNMPLTISIFVALFISLLLGLLTSCVGQKVRPEEFILICLAGVEIIRRLAFHFISFTGGAYGLNLSNTQGVLSNFEAIKIALAIVVVASFWLLHRWFSTTPGIEWRIVGRVPLGAQTLGINASRVKRLAGCWAGLAGGMAGTGYALGIGYLHPNDLSIDISLVALAVGISVTSKKPAVQLCIISFILFILRELFRLVEIGGTLRFGYFDMILGVLIIFMAFKISGNQTKG